MNKTNACITGIITRGVGGLYAVRPLCGESSGREYLCRARGVFRHERITPTPGDVADMELLAESGDSSGADGVITGIHARRNCLIRPPVANLTHLLIVIPVASPKPDLYYVDKLTAIADASGIDCTIIVNKCDLDRVNADAIAREYAGAGFRVFPTAAASGEGCSRLLEHVMRFADSAGGYANAAFAGVSGAGKSSIAGRLFPEISPEVGSVSRKTERGRHTTRAVELYPVSEGFFLADTPGFSMLDFERFDFFQPDKLTMAFREFAPYLGGCRYGDCTHTREEDCSVREAVASGRISSRRHESYCKLYSDIHKRPEWQRRQKDDK